MGFYGNITNTSRTQFQFDKIYPNRKEMDINCSKDGVYLGRYVLIEYDNEYHLDTFLRVWIKEGTNGVLLAYNNSNFSGEPIRAGVIKEDEIVYTSESNLTPSTGLTPKDCKFYICYSTGSSGPATFKPIDGLDEKYGYTYNYNIDLKEYSNGSGRGYDSTVWQKIYTNGEEKYVMIAELNTVVPTFDVVAEAPSMNPVIPHFDTESTNVYYKLHWQTPWGFRIAQAEDNSKSDEKTRWTEIEYDPNTGTNIIKDLGEKNAAIYFNKAAFDAQVDETSIKKKVSGANEIKIIPVSSGKQLYDDHNPTTKDPVAANDIQEMSINLPAIGNMMSDAWDIIHGPNRDNAKNDSLQGRLDSFKALTENQIPVVNTNNEIIGAVIGNLKISGYEPLYGSVADINEGDTLNIALAKLSNKVKDNNSSMTNYVNEKLADLTVQHTLTDDRYISGISQQNGLIGITTKSLPTYSLTSGETNGTVKFNDKEIEVTGLKSMAFENKEAFAPADILTTTRFDYSISATASSSTQFTIQELCRKVASLEQEIDELKAFHLTE